MASEARGGGLRRGRVPRVRAPGSWRRRALIVVVALISLLVLGRIVAQLYTDLLWFGSIGDRFRTAWFRRIKYQVAMGATAATAFFAFAGINFAVANRLAPSVLLQRNSTDVIEHYRRLSEHRRRTLWVGISALGGLMFGSLLAAQWQQLILFRYSTPFGSTDPQFGIDLGFYLTQLPLLTTLVGAAFAAVLLTTALVVLADVLNGSLRPPGSGPMLARNARIHLSLLLAILALVKGADYWLDRYRTVTSVRAGLTGAFYTDVHALIPALTLLALVAVFAAVAFVAGGTRQGWSLPTITCVVWTVLALVAGVAYPAVVQGLRVRPKQSTLESRFIEANINGTRLAFGLDQTSRSTIDYSPRPADPTLRSATGTLGNIRVLDPRVSKDTFTALQAKLGYLTFGDLDVDRYRVGDRERQVVIGTRDLDPSAIPTRTWEGVHLRYTHGYGVAMAPSNGVDPDGEPRFIVGGLPAAVDGTELNATEVRLDHPQLYYGEGFDGIPGEGYAIVGTSVSEEGLFKGERGSEPPGGVPVGDTVQRLAFALRFGDLEVLTSSYLGSKSTVLFRRGIDERLTAVAPFVVWDGDPYPVLLDGRIQYVVDGYTISDSMPFSQHVVGVDTQGRAGTGLSGRRFNYVVNSVKATVDAYDGAVHLYRTDDLYPAKQGRRRDPIIEAYARAFPGLFERSKDMTRELRSHLRYPEQLFAVQTELWGRYHLDSVPDFYSQADGWDVSIRPPDSANPSAVSSDAPTAPAYLQMQLPGNTDAEFVLFRPFAPHSATGAQPRKQLNAFMIARCDPGHYGELLTYEMTEEPVKGASAPARNRQVNGPITAHELMVTDTDSDLSEQLTQLNGIGGSSKVVFGAMVIVPIERSILYVRPIYVSGEGSGSAHQLRIVVVAVDGDVAVGSNLPEALAKLFPEADLASIAVASGSQPPQQTAGPSGTPSVAALLEQAVRYFDQADALLKSGGTAKMADAQDLTTKAEDLVRKALAAAADSPDTAVPSAEPAATAAPGAERGPNSPFGTLSPRADDDRPPRRVEARDVAEQGRLHPPVHHHLRRVGAARRLLPAGGLPALHGGCRRGRCTPRGDPHRAFQHLDPVTRVWSRRRVGGPGGLSHRPIGRAEGLPTRGLPPVQAGLRRQGNRVLREARRSGHRARPIRPDRTNLRADDCRCVEHALQHLRALQRDRRSVVGGRDHLARVPVRQHFFRQEQHRDRPGRHRGGVGGTHGDRVPPSSAKDDP
ncbi:MAG: UPF0182 family protein [Microthrixaceae bacterium]